MQTLNIKGDEINPTIFLDHNTNVFAITGESRPEYPLKYYEPVFIWFNEYFNQQYVLNDFNDSNNSSIRKLKIDLDYFNSTSAKVLFDLFYLLKHTGYEKFKMDFEIDWYYYTEDIDMFDAGTEMANMCGIKFNYLPKA